jgi:hypothetical protein
MQMCPSGTCDMTGWPGLQFVYIIVGDPNLICPPLYDIFFWPSRTRRLGTQLFKATCYVKLTFFSFCHVFLNFNFINAFLE